MKKILILFNVLLATLSCSSRPFSNPTDYIKYVAQVGSGNSSNTTRTVYYMLTLNVEGDGEVILNKNKYEEQIKIAKGTKINLEAIANTGSEFYGWSGSISSKDVILENVIMDKDITLLASFIVPTVWKNLYVNLKKGGSVYIDGVLHKNTTEDTIIITSTYEEGTTVSLKAESNNPDVDFGGWSGAVTSADNEITITLDESKILYVSFSIERYLNIDYDNTLYYVEVSIDGKPYTKYTGEIEVEFNDILKIKATAINSHTYEFAEWRGSSTDTQAEITITVGRSDISLTAIFKQIMKALTINNLQGQAMNYKINGNVYTGQVSMPIDTTVNVELTEKYYPFISWSGDTTGNSKTISVTLNDNKVLNATFETGAFDIYDSPNMNGYNASKFDNDWTIHAMFDSEEVPTYQFLKNNGGSWLLNNGTINEYKTSSASNTSAAGTSVSSMVYFQYRGINYYEQNIKSKYGEFAANRLSRFRFYRFTGKALSIVTLNNALCAVDTYTKLIYGYGIPDNFKKQLTGQWAPQGWWSVENKAKEYKNEDFKFYEYNPIGYVNADGTVVIFEAFKNIQREGSKVGSQWKGDKYLPPNPNDSNGELELDITKLNNTSVIRSPYY